MVTVRVTVVLVLVLAAVLVLGLQLVRVAVVQRYLSVPSRGTRLQGEVQAIRNVVLHFTCGGGESQG